VPILYIAAKSSPNLTDYLREQLRILNENNKKAGSALPLTDQQLAAFEAQTLPKSLS
jgi:hypothetical protein